MTYTVYFGVNGAENGAIEVEFTSLKKAMAFMEGLAMGVESGNIAGITLEVEGWDVLEYNCFRCNGHTYFTYNAVDEDDADLLFPMDDDLEWAIARVVYRKMREYDARKEEEEHDFMA